jgi:hypothetical protein
MSGRGGRDDGFKRLLQKVANRLWTADLLAYMKARFPPGSIITIEEVRLKGFAEGLISEKPCPNIVGAATTAALRAGLIKRYRNSYGSIEEKQPTSEKSHASTVKVYIRTNP